MRTTQFQFTGFYNAESGYEGEPEYEDLEYEDLEYPYVLFNHTPDTIGYLQFAYFNALDTLVVGDGWVEWDAACYAYDFVWSFKRLFATIPQWKVFDIVQYGRYYNGSRVCVFFPTLSDQAQFMDWFDAKNIVYHDFSVKRKLVEWLPVLLPDIVLYEVCPFLEFLK